ncbi:MAG: hypothetical protein AAFQ80_08995 [Cyanobacteria bacterium J06621_8]
MNKAINLPKLSTQTVNTLRDMAVEMESSNLRVAKELMHLAYLARPNGPFIKNKLKQYDRMLNSSPSNLQLKNMLASGELAIIPVGFRCHTKKKLKKHLGVIQASFPFDNGFFPPVSIASVIRNQRIDLNFQDNNSNHTVCIKYENYHDSVHGKGIKFKKSTYEEINAHAVSRDQDDINQYLDATYGYYTLDLKHKFILAHYNWHVFAHPKYSKGISDPKVNIDNINSILNRRISRMFDVCHAAKYIFFVFLEDKKHDYMMIDDQYLDLNDLGTIDTAIKKTFTAKSFVLKFSEVNSSEKILAML